MKVAMQTPMTFVSIVLTIIGLCAGPVCHFCVYHLAQRSETPGDLADLMSIAMRVDFASEWCFRLGVVGLLLHLFAEKASREREKHP